ncbi:hypothetical protein C8R48DRAFT_667596 [Suillus tomentosus]|nr:hypothetical protein C8R48DRAFT_667596 [Suillus tomentosus]
MILCLPSTYSKIVTEHTYRISTIDIDYESIWVHKKNPASARKYKAEQADIRRKMSDFRRQLEARGRVQAGVTKMKAAADVVETEVAVDVVEQRTKKRLGAVLKRWFGTMSKKWLSGMSKKRHVVVKEEGGNTIGEGIYPGDVDHYEKSDLLRSWHRVDAYNEDQYSSHEVQPYCKPPEGR